MSNYEQSLDSRVAVSLRGAICLLAKKGAGLEVLVVVVGHLGVGLVASDLGIRSRAARDGGR